VTYLDREPQTIPLRHSPEPSSTSSPAGLELARSEKPMLSPREDAEAAEPVRLMVLLTDRSGR